MKKYLLITAIALSPFTGHTSNIIKNDKIEEQNNCFTSIFENYDSWRGFLENKYKKRIKSEEKRLKKLSWFDSSFGEEKFNYYKNNLSCSTFKYFVDGNAVEGFVIKPKTSTEKLPILIYNRGGNGNYGGVVFGSMMHNLFPIANEGFIIVGSQYRGTFNKMAVNSDEFGGDDVHDVTALLDYVADIEGADTQRIGMYGASRGGMQTHLAMKKVTGIKAIATIAGNSDLLKGLEYRPKMENVYKKRIPDYEKNKISELEKRSVLSWVDELSPNIPILLLHGENDKRVSVKHSIHLAAALTEHKIPHKLVIYPDDDHGLRKNRESANKELVTWFKTNL
ncbi:alpha/beta hydrolase family protein [Litorilituus lipolyticus]|uniref:S9 family peptidase n=1 Tax=Litorilituus lipolyticus TaxID=2491017 RepID=A0A502KSP7_9GAMM|nr:prolyl oligopeptidase family serine peptidase [Litorilituus lipolyticus]TPH14602.1 S9 family peptidase [Litorilituus lipolyticus]